MGPDVTPIHNTATPLGREFVQHLQGLMDAESLGTGIGPLQQGAGKAITNFVNTGIGRMAEGGVDPAMMDLIKAMSKEVRVNTDMQAGDLREAFGAAGSRFGSSLAKGEGLLRGTAERGLTTEIARLMAGERGNQIAQSGQLLQAIAQMGAQGEAAINPFLFLTQLGMPQAENVVSPGLGSQLLTGALGIGGAFAGRGR